MLLKGEAFGWRRGSGASSCPRRGATRRGCSQAGGAAWRPSVAPRARGKPGSTFAGPEVIAESPNSWPGGPLRGARGGEHTSPFLEPGRGGMEPHRLPGPGLGRPSGNRPGLQENGRPRASHPGLCLGGEGIFNFLCHDWAEMPASPQPRLPPHRQAQPAHEDRGPGLDTCQASANSY